MKGFSLLSDNTQREQKNIFSSKEKLTRNDASSNKSFLKPKFSLTVAIWLLVFNLSTAFADPIRIMPLGDSITVGRNGSLTDDNYYVGYRQKLYLDLVNGRFDIDFVGGQNHGMLAQPIFDYNHEGHRGWCADGCSPPYGDIYDHVYTFLTANPADVVLLHIGTNDVSANHQNPGEIGNILDEIYRYNPNITVILARIVSRTDGKALQTRLFNDAVEAMAKDRSEYGDTLYLVDMENALNYPGDMGDAVHPNPTGYGKMADTWRHTLQCLLSRSLTVRETGTGNGTVTSDPEAIDYCHTGYGTHPYGSTVVLTATAAPGSAFLSWTGCDSVADTLCTVLINRDRNVTATFYLKYTLAVTLEGSGNGRVTSTPSGINCGPTCSNTFGAGTPIRLTAEPYSGSVLAYWSGACTGSTDTCDLIITDDIGVTAHFTSDDTKEYKLNVRKVHKNRGDGTITSNDRNINCGETCFHKYYLDTVVTLSAVANQGSTFIGWKPASLGCTGTGPCTVTVDKAKTVRAIFIGDYAFKVTAKSKKGGIGTVTSTPSGIRCTTGSKVGCTITYPYNEEVTLSASADGSSTFLGWIPKKLCPGTGECTVFMDKKRAIKAVFSGP